MARFTNWWNAGRGAARAVPALVTTVVAVSAVACSSATAYDGSAESSAPVTATFATPASGSPVLDERGVRLKNALGEAGLAAGLTDGTVLAVARGLCDQATAGVPEESILDTVRPIAAYAASVSGAPLSSDDAARRFVETTVGVYC